jgi:cold shock CspA family protein
MLEVGMRAEVFTGRVDFVKGPFAFLRTSATDGHVFVHRNDYAGNLENIPRMGDELQFRLVHTERGPRAQPWVYASEDLAL